MNADVSFSKPPAPASDAFLAALFVAVIVHVILIIGIHFSVPKTDKTHKTISVTIANMPAQKAPDKARFLAQENQRAAGAKTTEHKSPAQSIASLGLAGKRVQKPGKLASSLKKPNPVKKVVTQVHANTKINRAKKTPKETTKPQRPRLTPDRLARQLAQLGAEVRYKKPSTEQSRIKFINSVSTHKFLAAQYMEDWQRKVEKTGNMNYPETARQKHLTGKLTMDVGIRHDGRIYSIRISKSSGYKLLDDAAKRIVRMSAPFAPLPEVLRKELDVLVITRVWEFSDESGMSAN